MGDSLSARVRARIRDEMVKRKLNQTDVANLLEWKQSRISKILNGRTALGVDELADLCFAVSISVTEAVRDHGFEFCMEMTSTELRLFERYRALTPAQREAVITLMHIPYVNPRRKSG